MIQKKYTLKEIADTFAVIVNRKKEELDNTKKQLDVDMHVLLLVNMHVPLLVRV